MHQLLGMFALKYLYQYNVSFLTAFHKPELECVEIVSGLNSQTLVKSLIISSK
jgi:hypothetical protein